MCRQLERGPLISFRLKVSPKLRPSVCKFNPTLLVVLIHFEDGFWNIRKQIPTKLGIFQFLLIEASARGVQDSIWRLHISNQQAMTQQLSTELSQLLVSEMSRKQLQFNSKPSRLVEVRLCLHGLFTRKKEGVDGVEAAVGIYCSLFQIHETLNLVQA